jgi:hypothetical protein
VGWAPWQADQWTRRPSSVHQAAPARGSIGAPVRRWLTIRSATTTSVSVKSAWRSELIRLSTLVPWSGNSTTSSVAEASRSITTGSSS